MNGRPDSSFITWAAFGRVSQFLRCALRGRHRVEGRWAGYIYTIGKIDL